jgi:hypothetical protein
MQSQQPGSAAELDPQKRNGSLQYKTTEKRKKRKNQKTESRKEKKRSAVSSRTAGHFA